MYNLFYEEPENDRWFKYDRYPRKIIRRIIRGPEPIGGVKRWFVNLCAGLDRAGIRYLVNDYKSLTKGPNQWALVIGKPHVVEKIPDNINIIYGPGVAAHPYDNDFWMRKPNIKHLLISCDWFKKMYERDLPREIPITIWPSGVEVDKWVPKTKNPGLNSILIYDKIRWERNRYKQELLNPIFDNLNRKGIKIEYLKYGSYKEEDFQELLGKVDGMIFLCEHETQGFAYLQTLSCAVPIYAWDRGGYWKDPAMYPHNVKFEEVTSVPYWDARCGEKFKDLNDFQQGFNRFWDNVKRHIYNPREYVLENFKLEDRAEAYVRIIDHITNK